MKKLAICCFVLVWLSGCADTVSYGIVENISTVGFWHGLWHGMILPFSWIGSLFSEDISIYAVYNNGGWYDFGFALGTGAILGGSSSRKK